MISQRKKSRGVLADGSANPVDVYVGNSQSPCQLYSSSAPLPFDKGDPLYDQQNIAMLKSIAKIKNPNLKQALYTLVATLTE